MRTEAEERENRTTVQILLSSGSETRHFNSLYTFKYDARVYFKWYNYLQTKCLVLWQLFASVILLWQLKCNGIINNYSVDLFCVILLTF